MRIQSNLCIILWPQAKPLDFSMKLPTIWRWQIPSGLGSLSLVFSAIDNKRTHITILIQVNVSVNLLNFTLVYEPLDSRGKFEFCPSLPVHRIDLMWDVECCRMLRLCLVARWCLWIAHYCHSVPLLSLMSSLSIDLHSRPSVLEKNQILACAKIVIQLIQNLER